MKKLIFIAFFISGLCSALFAQTDKATVEGVVRDSDGKPLSFATMFIAELGTGVSTDLEGKFRFTGTKGTEYTLNVSYLNHVDKEVKVKAGSPEPLVIVLEEQSYELAEVVVMADYKKNQGSTAVINQQALEHIQPTSVADVLSLIPADCSGSRVPPVSTAYRCVSRAATTIRRWVWQSSWTASLRITTAFGLLSRGCLPTNTATGSA